jgi:uncharacterized protein
MKHLLSAVVILASANLLLAQNIQVNRQNKTIAVTADDSVTADAEVAVLEIGYRNYAPTQDAAFHENVRATEQITNALLGAKIPKANIETEKLQLTRAEFDEKWTPEMKKERQFTASQAWHITVAAADAQTIVDLAVKAGANEVGDVEWNVANPVALQAKAGAAALAKARSIAEQMAKGLGTKLGELVYASNRAPFAGISSSAELIGVNANRVPPPPPPKLTLFPQKVKSDATVYAVFSIE